MHNLCMVRCGNLARNCIVEDYFTYFFVSKSCTVLRIKLIKCTGRDKVRLCNLLGLLQVPRKLNTEATNRRQILVNWSRLQLQATIKLQVMKRLPFLISKILSNKPVMNSSAAYFKDETLKERQT